MAQGNQKGPSKREAGRLESEGEDVWMHAGVRGERTCLWLAWRVEERATTQRTQAPARRQKRQGSRESAGEAP